MPPALEDMVQALAVRRFKWTRCRLPSAGQNPKWSSSGSAIRAHPEPQLGLGMISLLRVHAGSHQRHLRGFNFTDIGINGHQFCQIPGIIKNGSQGGL